MPLSIKIPQYAYYVDGAKEILVIVIQAEEAQGRKLVGARNFKGQHIVGFISDFKLLGERRPK